MTEAMSYEIVASMPSECPNPPIVGPIDTEP